MMNIIFSDIKESLATDKIDNVINTLKICLIDTDNVNFRDEENSFILVSAKWHELRKRELKGSLVMAEVNRMKNTIRENLLQIINNLEDQSKLKKVNKPIVRKMGREVEFKLELNKNLLEFELSEQRQLLNAIDKLTGVGSFTISKIKNGSIIYYLRMDIVNAIKLKSLIQKKKLEKFNIVNSEFYGHVGNTNPLEDKIKQYINNLSFEIHNTVSDYFEAQKNLNDEKINQILTKLENLKIEVDRVNAEQKIVKEVKVPVEVIREVEVIKEVRVEVIREVEVIKEVPIEIIKEVEVVRSLDTRSSKKEIVNKAIKDSKNESEGKFFEIVDKYEASAKKMGWTVDRNLLEKVAKGCGPSIYRKDAALVAASDPKELERVKKNFLIKKLGMKDTPKLDAAIANVFKDFQNTRHKPRALFYYKLVVNLRKKTFYN